jgi:uncharacterized membrane protein (DUF106 family)
MWQVNRIATAVFDAFFSVMESWPGWASLTVLSALTGAIALVAYKYTSNQLAIGRVHNDIRAALLAAKLYKDDIGVTLQAQGKLFSSAAKLFLLSLQPLAVMIVPMVLLLAQMAPRYEWQPLRPGDEITFYAELHEQTPPDVAPVRLDVSTGVTLMLEPARYFGGRFKEHAQRHFVAARLRVDQPGRHVVTLHVADASADKELMASDHVYARMSPIRPGASFWDQVLYAVEQPAGKDDLIQKIWIEPVRPGNTSVFGIEWHWVIWWLILSMIIALLVKPFVNVQMW